MTGGSLLGDAALLTAVGMLSQAVGFVYRILLSRVVGAQVMGLYHLVMPVYAVLLSLCSVGFSAACNTLTARYRALGRGRAAAQTLGRCLTGSLRVFCLLAPAVFLLSDPLSVSLLGDARTRLGLVLLLPCVLLTAVENIHKHFFYGLGRVGPPALTETLEGLVRAGAVLGLLRVFLPQSPEGTVGLMVWGMILCEVFSAVTLTVAGRRAVGALPAGEGLNRRGLGRQVRRVAIPTAWNSLLGNLMGAALAVLVPNRLVRAGVPVAQAVGALGRLQGMTLPLLGLPTALLAALGPVLLPRLTYAHALGQRERCLALARRAISLTVWVIFPAAVLLGVLAEPLGRLLFRESGVGEYALPLALGVALACVETVLAVCLNGLGRQDLTARNALLSGAVQLGLTWWRMGRIGVGLRGYVEALLVSTLLGLGLNWTALRRRLPLRFQWFHWLVAPGLGALLAGLWTRLLYPILASSGLGEVLPPAVCLLCGSVLYLCALLAQGVFRAE